MSMWFSGIGGDYGIYNKDGEKVAEFYTRESRDRATREHNALNGIPDPAALMAAVKDLMELMSHGYVPPVWWTVVLKIKSLLPPDAEEG